MRRKTCVLSRKEMLRTGAEAGILLSAVSFLFYNGIAAVVPLLPAGYLYVKEREKEIEKKRSRKRKSDFKEALACMAVSLSAGHSAQSALEETAASLTAVCGAEAEMTREFTAICGAVRLGRPAEKELLAFGERSEDEDIENFAFVFYEAVRTGGDLADVIRTTASVLREKEDVERAIEASTAAQRLECAVMSVMPLLLLLFARLTFPDLLSLMYTTLTGRLVMTVCAAVWGIGVYWGKKITEITV